MTDAPVVRILLAEDNLLTRLGIANLISTDAGLCLVAEVADGAEALTAYRRLHPDVVLSDLKMPVLDGIQLTAALARETPPGRVLVLTQYEGDESIQRALKAGALGYVTKDADGDELLAAIRVVARGRRFLPGAIAARLAEQVARPGLSLRELEVLTLVAEGLSNQEIAARLSVSERTVGVHISAILHKLEAKSRTHAVSIALKRGILDPPR